MSKVEVNQVTQQCGTTLTVGGGACKTAVVDATTVTLGRCGATVSLASGATQSGFGRTGTVDWITTPKVTGDSPITGVTGKGYFLDTTAGTITINLPAGAAGSIVSVMDYAATWASNKVTISPNGSEKIGGLNENAILNTNGQSVTFVYVDSTQGWLNTMDSTSNVRGGLYMIATGGTPCSGDTCGNCKVHTFTGPGTFCVSQVASCAANNLVSYMVVAGGAGSGYSNYAAGGGSGGFRELVSPTAPYTASPLDGYPSAPNRITVSASPYSITVGGGGAGGVPATDTGRGVNGNNSVFSSITSTGGGGGGAYVGGPVIAQESGLPGGSGGGTSATGSSPKAAGLGNTPPTTPAQGFDGGNGIGCSGGGGGGATTVGATGGPGGPTPGGSGNAGGAGATTQIPGSSITKSAGGRGTAASAPTGPSGGCNTGDGGSNSAGAGGSGVVIIRYKFQ